MTVLKSHIDEWKLNVEPRPWQISALKKWNKKNRGVLSVVTGGGKTVFAFLAILNFIRKFPSKGVIVVVPTLTLLDQWHVAFTDELNVQAIDIACFSSQEKSKTFKKVNIFSINTARKYIPILKEPENYFLIVDECHRSGSAANSNSIKGRFAATLGLSATPVRQYDDGFERFIKPHLGEIIYDYEYSEALADKVISPFELMNVKVPFLKHEEDNYSKITRKLKFLLSRLKEDETVESSIKNCLIQRARLSANALMRVPVTVKIAIENRNERLLIFHESIEAANEIYSALIKRKFPVSLYHSKIPPILRRNNLQMYKKGIYNILITCKALDEGMNVPETTVAIVSSSSSSIRQRVQRLGRVLRPSKGKDMATIFTLFITDQEKNRLIKEYKKFEDKINTIWLNTVY